MNYQNQDPRNNYLQIYFNKIKTSGFGDTFSRQLTDKTPIGEIFACRVSDSNIHLRNI